MKIWMSGSWTPSKRFVKDIFFYFMFILNYTFDQLIKKISNLIGLVHFFFDQIVKHIGEAPFLVQIFSKGEKNEGIRVEREATTPDAWPHIQKRWAGKKIQPPPDGIILVSELKEDLEEEHAMEHGDRPTRSIGFDGGLNQVWGLLVQGRGMECVACYILNTCRVFSPAGCCTHFYVARAQCFGDPIDVQMRNVWLQSKRRSE
jgi:hypothetical protein